MASNPWDKWYWNDWENDPALKLCSLAAQGLWMRMLCICAKADPKGYLLVAGQPVLPSDLARLVGTNEDQVETLLSELASKGVFSLDRKSRIYSRRMLRDVHRSRVAQQNGRNGGNPTLRNDWVKPSLVNPPDNPAVKTHIPEASIQKKEDERPKPAKSRISYPPDFEEFWTAYPTDSLMSKKATYDAWKRLEEEDRTSATASVSAFRLHCAQNPTYRPVHAVRYLAQRRFDGFAAVASRSRGTVHVRKESPDWHVCERRWVQEKGRPPPVDTNGGWRFPTDWLEPRAH